MYAIKKHINKALAVFLCACLLLSYNPAFGAVDAAWAADPANPADPPFGSLQGQLAPTQSEVDAGVNTTDPNPLTPDGSGNWNASTEVRVTTFNSELKTDASETVFGKVADIASADPQIMLMVEATCAQGKNLNAYDFVWSVKENGKAMDAAVAQKLSDVISAEWITDRSVARSKVNLSDLFGNTSPSPFKDGNEYSFSCDISLKADSAIRDTRTITVYTVDQSQDNYTKTRLEDNDPTVVATGKFLESAQLGTVLATANKVSVTDAFINVAGNKPHSQGSSESFSINDDNVYQVGITGGLPVSDELSFPPSKAGEKIEFYFPIDPAYLDGDGNTRGYNEGDEITLLWTGDATGAGVKEVKAVVAKDTGATGEPLMAKVVYDPSSKTVTGKDNEVFTPESGWNNEPGFFTIMYSSLKAKPSATETTYYTVNKIVRDTVSGVITGKLSGAASQKQKTGTATEFDIIATNEGDARYQLSELNFKSSPGAMAVNVLDATKCPAGISIDPTHSHVKLDGDWIAASAYDKVYEFEAVFVAVNTTVDPTDPSAAEVNLQLSVVDDSAEHRASDKGLIRAAYAKKGETDLVTAQTDGSNVLLLNVLKAGQASLSFMVHAGENGTNYEIKGVETSINNMDWFTASWQNCVLNLPSLDGNLYVRLIVGATTSSTPPTQPSYYNLTVASEGGVGCTATSDTTIIAVGSTTSKANVTMTGISGSNGYYPSAVKVQVGSQAQVDGGYTNAAKDYSDTYEFDPTNLSLTIDGDVTITVVFTSKASEVYTLTLGGPINGGSVVPLGGWSLTDGKFTGPEGTSLPFQITPNDGYEIDSITYDGEDVVGFKNGVLPFSMPDKSGTLQVTFKKSSSTPTGERTLNVYVADDSLDDAGASTRYIWDASGDGTQVPAGDTSWQDAISLTGSSAEQGSVNSATDIEGISIEKNAYYDLNFEGATDGTSKYVVKKVLVVEYTSEGTTKHVESRTLNYWGNPTFQIQPSEYDTDVIVYFGVASESDVVPSDGDYWTVTVQVNDCVSDDWTPGESVIKVYKGSSVTLSNFKLLPNDDDYEYAWDGDNAFVVDGAKWGNAFQAAGCSYKVTPTKNCTVQVNGKKTDSTNPTVKYKVYAADPSDSSSDPQHGKVTVTPSNDSGMQVDHDSYKEVNADTSFTIGFQADSEYELSRVAFKKPGSATVYAAYKLNAGLSGNKYNSLKMYSTEVARDAASSEGYTAYNWDDAISVDDDTKWLVEGIASDLTICPTFSKIEKPTPPSDATWTIKAGVGSGNGRTWITYNGNDLGNEVHVPKDPASTAIVNFEPANGYKVKSVNVKRSSDNAFVNIWETLTGGNRPDWLGAQALAADKLTLTNVDHNYEVYVDFESTNPDVVDDTVAINVFSDANKGTVLPNQNVRAKKDGEQQFVAYTLTDDEGKYYVVKEVKLTAHGVMSGNPTGSTSDKTIAAGATSNYLSWQTAYNNVFTVNVAALAGEFIGGTLNSIDVEVIYKKGTSTSDPADDVKNGTKTIKIKTNGAGGMVSPIGEYTVYPYKVKDSDEYAKFLVTVSPVQGYEFSGITVKRGTATSAENEALAAEYLKQIRGESTSSSGCFYIEADPDREATMQTEEIELSFTKLATVDSTYTIKMNRPVNEDNYRGSVVPTKDVRLATNQSYSYTVSPQTENTGVTQIEDYYTVDGERFPVPADKKAALSKDGFSLTVNPLTIMGKVVDREITVHFGYKAGGTKIPAASKANIKVTVHGPGIDAINVWPSASLKNIYRSNDSRYAYEWEIPQSSDYYIYAVKANDTWLLGDSETAEYGDSLAKSGNAVFGGSNIPKAEKSADLNSNNTLDIYTGSFPNGYVPRPGGSFEGDTDGGGFIVGDFTTPGTGTITPSSSNWFGTASETVVGMSDEDMRNALYAFDNNDEEDADNPDEGGNTQTGDGTDGDNNQGGSNTGNDGSNTDGDSEEEDINKDPNTPTTGNLKKVYTLVPTPGKVIEHMYLYNCHPIAYKWRTPKEALVITDKMTEEQKARITAMLKAFGASADKKIVLEYTLELDTPNSIGYMYGVFKNVPVDQIQDQTWNPTDPDKYEKLGKDNLMVEFSPKDVAEEIAPLFSPNAAKPIDELYNGSVIQGDTIAVRPSVSDEDAKGYTVIYSTVPIQSDDTFTFMVGPLYSTTDANKLYTIDSEKLPTSVTAAPVKTGVTDTRTPNGAGTVIGAAATKAADEQAGSQKASSEYYRYYTVSGSARDLLNGDGTVKLDVPLKKLALSDGSFPEYKGSTPAPETTYTLTASAGEGGKLVPRSVSGTDWTGGQNNGPWTLKSGTIVSFRVDADDGFVLTELTRNETTNCLSPNGDYDASTKIVTFDLNANTVLEAKFEKEDTPAALRTVTIEVEGGHGTTNPAPGPHQVQKGQTYPITFKADKGYVPYRVWVDGVQGYVSPTRTDWTLPASWSDQTFKVQYALAGTTPTTGDYLTQTGQNLATQAGAALAKTGDNPWPLIALIVVAGGAAFAVIATRRRKATAARAAKYSVTRRR